MTFTITKFNLNPYLKIFVTLLVFMYFVNGEPPVKDRSELILANPKYFQDVELVMSRKRQSAPYTTNITLTTMQTWGANLTFNISYPLQRGKMFNMVLKGCEGLDKLWMVELMVQFSNVTACPLPPGRYGYFNLGSVPKFFPGPYPSSPGGSSNRLVAKIFLTSTKEVILSLYLHLQAKRR